MRLISFFDNENNYIFDSIKLEFLSGKINLIPQVGTPEAYIYVKLDDNQGLVAIDSSGNNRHGAFQGGYSELQWVAGKINYAIQGLTTTNGFINFDQYGNFERTDTFSLECWVKTTSSATMSLISKQKNTSPFEGYTINILSGKVRCVIRDNINVLSIENNTIINDGIWHHIVFTYDGTSLITGCHIYVDNTENDNIIASTTLTNTIISSVNLQVSGRDGNNNCIDSNTYIDEVVIYERALTPAEISYRWNSGNGTQNLPGSSTSYPIDNPSLKPQGNVRVKEITTFNATISTTGLNNVFFVILVNGTRKYWNGSNWVDSSGYPQVNTYSEINSNIGFLSITNNVLFSYEAFFHSEDGSETPYLEEVYYDYNFELDQINITTVNIIGNLRDLIEILPGEEFKVRPSWIISTNTITIGSFINVTTDIEGNFIIPIKIEDEEPTFLEWQIKDKIYKTNFINQEEVKFSDLTIIWQNETEIDWIGN